MKVAERLEGRGGGEGGDQEVEEGDGKKDGDERRGAGAEVELADDPGYGGADHPAGQDGDGGEGESFKQKEAVDGSLRAPEGLHKREVAAPLKDGGRKSGEDADGDGEGDEEDGAEHEGVGLLDDARFAFNELPDGIDMEGGKRGAEMGEGRVDGVVAAGNLELDEAGSDAGPGAEGWHGQIDAAIFVAAGGEAAGAVEGEGLAVVAEGDRALVCDELRRFAAEKNVGGAGGPAIGLPPAAELLQGRKVGADGNDGSVAVGSGDGEGEL